MALLRGSARLLLEEHRRRPFGGSVLDLGKLLVFFTLPELECWAREQGVELTAVPDPALSHIPGLAERGCMDDVTFYRSLGFDRVISCDISDYEGADRIFDLNRRLPEDMEGQFDAVVDSGTLQHIFDVPNALHNLHRALRVGGRMIFAQSPSHNHVDHGFYMFSPTLFADVYRTFGYRIEAFFLFDFVAYWYHGRFYSTPFRIYAYEPGCLDHLCYGRWGNRQTGIFVVATKLPDSSAARTPQQGTYLQVWRDAEEAGAQEPAAGSPSRRAGRLVLAWKRLRETAARVLPKRLPPIVARY